MALSGSSLFAPAFESGDELIVELDSQLSPWSWEIEQDTLFCAPDLLRLHGVTTLSAVGARPFDPTQSLGTDASGLDADGVTGARGWLRTLSEPDRIAIEAFVRGLLESNEGGEVEYRIRRGRETRTLITHAVVADGEPRRVIGYTQDVTATRRAQNRMEDAQRALEHQRRVLREIASGQPLTETLEALGRHLETELPGARCAIMVLDRDAAELRLGVTPSLPAGYGDAIDGTPVGEGLGACGSAASRRRDVIVEDIRADPLMANYVELMDAHGLRAVWSHPLQQASGQVLGVLSVYYPEPHRPDSDELRLVAGVGTIAALAIEREGATQTIIDAGNVDRRTGLPNRSRFLELVNERLQTGAERPSVMFLDVDRFRQLTDSLGHLVGDRIAVAIAERLTTAVGEDAIIARFSEDGFALTTKPGGDLSAEELATRVLTTFDTPITVGGGEFFLLPALGIAHSDGDTDAYGLVRDAAAAMHVARAEGLRGQQVYDQRLRARVIERIASETSLRRAIRGKELVMHYQPILNLKTGEWDRVEALVRWLDPQRGLIPPTEFIPLAEQTGLVVPLGEKVLEMVTAETCRWRGPADLRIAVNVSVMQLASPTFARELLEVLARTPFPPGSLVVEVTESALMRNFDAIHTALADLRAAGLGVALDDFGTGYSSLARLGELPITAVKIDSRFIRRLGGDTTARSIVRAVADIASAHGLETVAEGIEDAATLAEVVALGCDYAQGFHLSRPITAEAAQELVSAPAPARLLGQLRVTGH